MNMESCLSSFLRLRPSRQVLVVAGFSITLWPTTSLRIGSETGWVETKKGDP